MFDTVLVANRGEIAVPRHPHPAARWASARSPSTATPTPDARHVARGRRRRADRPGRRRAELPRRSTPILDAARAHRRAGRPPRLRLPRRERALRRGLRRAPGSSSSGRRPTAIEVMGDKIRAKETVAAAGVPVVPGLARPGLTDAELAAAAAAIGYPVLIKPSAGGGGKGMQLVRTAADLPDALAPPAARPRLRSATTRCSSSGSSTRPRHIEVQVLADAHGNVIHLGERECSLQRRHQKIIEEAPSPLLDAATRARDGRGGRARPRAASATSAPGRSSSSSPADRPDEFFFMEMNTRLQVEHPVTELVTGLDLVEWQLRVAAGEPLPLAQDDVAARRARRSRPASTPRTPRAGFLPTGGTVLALGEPDGTACASTPACRPAPWSAATTTRCSPRSSPAAHDRADALARLDARPAPTPCCSASTTNIGFLRALLADPDVRRRATSTPARSSASRRRAGRGRGAADVLRRGRRAALAPSGPGAASTRGRRARRLAGRRARVDDVADARRPAQRPGRGPARRRPRRPPWSRSRADHPAHRAGARSSQPGTVTC